MKRTYPPGYFTELIRLHNWPPNYIPQQLDRGAQLRAEAALRGSAELRQKLAKGARIKERKEGSGRVYIDRALKDEVSL